MPQDLPGPRSYGTRDERLRPRGDRRIDVHAKIESWGLFHAQLTDLSRSGLRCLVFDTAAAPFPGTRLSALRLIADGVAHDAPSAVLRRTEPVLAEGVPTGLVLLGLAFDRSAEDLLAVLAPLLSPSEYVTDELRGEPGPGSVPGADAGDRTLVDFYRADSADLFEKCRAFHCHVKDLQASGLYQALYRVTLTSGLDHRITVFNPLRRREEEMVCFDSNSYLGLHLHPRVTGAVRRGMEVAGYGTPSAQPLGGTNRWLRELEEVLARFHGREDALVFSSGYSAGVGAIVGLVRENDLVVTDRLSHASLHAGARASGSRFSQTYAHGDPASLERALVAGKTAGCLGKLVASDGVFAANGRLAPLPRLVELARRHGARLLLDDANATGVLGPNGRGSEEHFGLAGAADILMGTFSKAAGSIGGYVCGSRELIYYLRFYAPSAMFTAAPPAALCAGVAEAFRVMEEEPDHRIRLWENVRALAPALGQAGLLAPVAPESAIVTIFLGSSRLLWRFCRDLFDEGIKCGATAHPVVPAGEAMVRLAVNARHTAEDLARTVEAFARLGKKYDILGRSREEVAAIGDRLT